MPDDLDYAWLGELLRDPRAWSDGDAATVRSMIATQRAALAEEHPRDATSRLASEQLIDELEIALAVYEARA